MKKALLLLLLQILPVGAMYEVQITTLKSGITLTGFVGSTKYACSCSCEGYYGIEYVPKQNSTGTDDADFYTLHNDDAKEIFKEFVKRITKQKNKNITT